MCGEAVGSGAAAGSAAAGEIDLDAVLDLGDPQATRSTDLAIDDVVALRALEPQHDAEAWARVVVRRGEYRLRALVGAAQRWLHRQVRALAITEERLRLAMARQ
jgi:hypothetical protein